MRGFTAAVIAATSLFVSSVVADVDPIVIKGQHFFYKTNGTQFYIRGVAYQPNFNAANGTATSGAASASTTDISTAGYTDPLANGQPCTRDIPYLTQLGTNTIRVYALDPTQDHDQCMTALQNAGIYVLADLSSPSESIDRNDPAWTYDLYNRYTSVVDAMAKYNNVLGFFAGNEVANAPNNTDSSAFVKAAVRDTKAYIKAKNYRAIGVGYATNDDASIRTELAAYFNCGDQSSAIDFWGYNIYSWCGDSSYTMSGYDQRTKEFEAYSVPAFFAEYGCNTPSPRMFTEVGTLYGSMMTPVWSGGIVYEYFQEENNFGLVSVSGNSVSTLVDYNNLKTQLASISPSATQMSAYTPSNSPAACPTEDATWDAASSPLPKTPSEELCGCMYNSLACTVNSNVDATDFGTLFGTVCGLNNGAACVGIAHNGSTGTYGAYGMCNTTQQLGYVLNQYYKGQNSVASACSFGGSAAIKSATTAGSSCSALLNQVGTAGTGSASLNPTATGNSGSGSSGGSSSSTGSKGAAGIVSVPGFTTGTFPMVVTAVLTVTSVIGMLVL